MDAWELHFREQSKRRWARHARVRAAKGLVLALLLGAVLAAIVLLARGTAAA